MIRSFLAAALLMLGACAIVAPLGDPSVGDQVAAPVEAMARRTIETLFPSQCLLVHKVRVDAGTRDLVLTGYLLLDRKKGFQAVAVDEFGGKVFEFESCRGRSEVRFAPPGLDHDILLRGPLQDLMRLFLKPEELRVRRSPEGQILISWIDNGVMIQCRAGADGGRIEGCDETRERDRVRSISFSYDASPTSASSIPSTINIVNHKLHYTMRAELLKVEYGLGREVCP